MGVINRDLDNTQRRVRVELLTGAVATGVTTVLGTIDNPGLLVSLYATAFGLSGTPTVTFNLYRFNATGGFTSLPLGSTAITVPAFGTSGLIALGTTTLAGITSSGVTCLSGDLLVALSGGANSSVTTGVFGGVFQRQIDFLKFPGT